MSSKGLGLGFGSGVGVGEVGSDQGSRVLLFDVSLSGEGYVATCGRIGKV